MEGSCVGFVKLVIVAAEEGVEWYFSILEFGRGVVSNVVVVVVAAAAAAAVVVVVVAAAAVIIG